MNIEVIKSNRKTMTLEVTREGRIIVRAPLKTPQSEIERFVRSKSDWLEKNLEKVKQRKDMDHQRPKLSMDEIHTLAQKAMEVLPERTAYFSAKIGVSYGGITIRNQRTRWGGCSSKGNLNFNCLLMVTPPEIQDYVVVHELCHRKEMNHSDRFWKEVEKILSDYKERKAWLKEHGGEIMARMI